MNYSNQNPKKHRIRLHGPWRAEVTWCESENNVGETTVGKNSKVHIPSNWEAWLGSSFFGTVSYVRNFGCPTGLRENQKVWLVVDEVDFTGSVWLNDSLLAQMEAGEPPLEIEIGDQLNIRNVLKIDVSLKRSDERPRRTGGAGGLIGGVRLEIED